VYIYSPRCTGQVGLEESCALRSAVGGFPALRHAGCKDQAVFFFGRRGNARVGGSACWPGLAPRDGVTCAHVAAGEAVRFGTE
jgi:hypothetical protein